ncbi:hypothetical protein CBR_g70745 [Chara braunii]|uniref:Uncharacterized protein n=1 Tax=Chara braunii TaxID=69332 RepID=A0A388KA20_CHABU|nr:hypothetical protein CBR_g70745 [Chara braunii]|eukprot:GBG66869.1 hypothetical protein CBR_g70745 [Chara braunii]
MMPSPGLRAADMSVICGNSEASRLTSSADITWKVQPGLVAGEDRGRRMASISVTSSRTWHCKQGKGDFKSTSGNRQERLRSLSTTSSFRPGTLGLPAVAAATTSSVCSSSSVSLSFPLSFMLSCSPWWPSLHNSGQQYHHHHHHHHCQGLAGYGGDTAHSPFTSAKPSRCPLRIQRNKKEQWHMKGLAGDDDSVGPSTGKGDLSHDEGGRGRDVWDDDDDGLSRLAADIESMKAQKERVNRSAATSNRSRAADRDIGSRFGSVTAANDGGASSGSGWKDLLDKVLVVDFFFVCVALLWLVGGLVERAAFNRTNVIETWATLWTPLFQPALGILMAGALVSGLAGYFSGKDKK